MQLPPTLVDTLQDLPVWASLTILILLSLIGAWLVARITLWCIYQLAPTTDSRIDDVLFAELRPPLIITVGLAGVYAAVGWLALAATDQFVLGAGATSVLIFVWGRALIRIGRGSISTLDRDSGAMDVAPILENLWSFTIVVAAVFAILFVWRIDITPFLASAGIAGIAIGFAARDTIANFFGSIALHVDDTYRVGDYIDLDSGISGTVIDVSVRSTRILTRDDVVVTVPNAVLNATQVSNRSQPRSHTRVKIPVGVAYGSDLDTVEATLLKAAEAVELVVASPAPRARFRGFGDSALEYELLCWVDSPHHEGRARHELHRGVNAGFADADIEIPFPQQDVTLHTTSSTATLPGEVDRAGLDPGTGDSVGH